MSHTVAVGIFSLLHIALASLAVGFMMLAPIAEGLGRTRPHYTDLAHGMARFTLVTYTTSLVLAVIMIELFIGLFPLTNSWLFNRFRYPIFLAVGAFLVQLFLLYPYYHYWDAIRARSSRLHLAMGIGAALGVLVWVGVLDGIGSYMLTPAEPDGPWSILSNPSWLPLVVHRFIGNLVITGYLLAAYGVSRLGRAPAAHDDTYRLMTRVGMLVGVGALLLQPVAGLIYALTLDAAAPDAYAQLVHGRYQGLVRLQFTLIALLFIGTALWLQWATSSRLRFGRAEWVIVIAAPLMVAAVGHPDLRRVFTFVVLAGTLAMLWRQGVPVPDGSMAGPRLKTLTVTLAVVAVATYLTMGTIRETARRPDTIRGVISLHDEAHAPAAYR